MFILKTIWDDEILKLERRLRELKKYQALTREGKKRIEIGTVIVDTEEDIEMKVSKLGNGSNDFEAHPVDSSSARKHGKGYSYLARNWKIK